MFAFSYGNIEYGFTFPPVRDDHRNKSLYFDFDWSMYAFLHPTGSFASASCTSCKYRVSGDQIKDDIFAQKIPYCPRCRPKGTHQAAYSANGTWSFPSSSNKNSVINATDDNSGTCQATQFSRYSAEASFGILKPDIVFFGEDLSSEFHNTLASDVKETDLVLVMGSSLKVRPVSHIPSKWCCRIPKSSSFTEPF